MKRKDGTIFPVEVSSRVIGVDGIRSIRSSSRLGSGRIVVEFVTSRDIDQAAGGSPRSLMTAAR